jgi:hypothetical protein
VRGLSIKELREVITITFQADTPEQLRQMLLSYVNALGAEAEIVSMTQHSDTEASVTAGKGRSRKARAAKTDEAELPEGTSVEPVEPADRDAALPAPENLPVHEPPAINVVSDLTPAQAREKALRELQAYFARTPDALPKIAAIQKKHGVSKLADTPDDKAHDMLADVLLLVGGSEAVPA